MSVTTYSAVAAQDLPTVSKGTIERISSLASEYISDRYIDVWLPPGYPQARDYDVLYMHDGRMLFDATTTWNKQEWQVDEIAGMLIEQGKVRPFIVVAIPNAGVNRHSEFYPQRPFESLTAQKQSDAYKLFRGPDLPLFATKVYSQKYLQFIVEELIPYIESNYIVNKGGKHRYLGGSSMGGLISWYGLMEYPNEFAGAISMSTHWPGVTDDGTLMFGAFLSYIGKGLATLDSQKLYFDHGNKTLDALYPVLQHQIDELLIKHQYPKNQWRSLFFSGASHNEKSWAHRLDIPLKFMFPVRKKNSNR